MFGPDFITVTKVRGYLHSFNSKKIIPGLKKILLFKNRIIPSVIIKTKLLLSTEALITMLKMLELY